MRFDFDAYEKVYPPKPETQPIESAVDTFKPTEEEIKAKDNQPGEEVTAPEPEGETNGNNISDLQPC